MKITHLAAAACAFAGTAATAGTTVTAVDPATYATNNTDVFDIAQGATIVANTPVGVGPVEAAIGFQGGDSFNSLVFSDSGGRAQSFTLRTALPALAVGGFNLFLSDDSQTYPQSPDRTFTQVSLSGSVDGTTFTQLATANLQQYFQTYGSRLIQVSGTFQPGAYQFFRFDGLGSSNVGLYGGRVVELDAIGAVAGPVPEPATWGMMILGFGALGYAMRRRAKARTNVSFA